MKICIFHPYDFNGTNGGTDIYVAKLVSFLIDKGIDLIIACPSNNYLNTYWNGVKLYKFSLYGDGSYPYLEGINEDIGKDNFYNIIELERPDIVHFHGFGKPYLSLLMFLKDRGIKTILTPHLASLSCMKTSLVNYQDRPCDGKINLRTCSKCYLNTKIKNNLLLDVFSVGEFLFSRVIVGFNGKENGKFLVSFRVRRLIELMRIINNGFDKIIVLNPWYLKVLELNGVTKPTFELVKTNFSNRMRELSEINNTLEFLFAGRQNKSKGLFLLLEAMNNVAFKNKVQLTICGAVTEEDDVYIENTINNMNSNNVIIKRFEHKEYNEVMTIMENSHLVIIPSVDSEMCPLTLLEAQASCIPVLGSNHTGISDLITDGLNGFLFESNNILDLRNKLEKLANNPILLLEVNEKLIKSENHEQDFMYSHLRIYNELFSYS